AGESCYLNLLILQFHGMGKSTEPQQMKEFTFTWLSLTSRIFMVLLPLKGEESPFLKIVLFSKEILTAKNFLVVIQDFLIAIANSLVAIAISPGAIALC